MPARVRSLSYGRRAAIGPLAPTITAAGGAPGTVVPVPGGVLLLTGFGPAFSSVGFKLARIRVLSMAPLQPGPARAPRTMFPASGQTVYTPAGRSLSLSGFVPSVATASVIVTTPTGSLVLTGMVSDDGIGIAGAIVAMMQPEQRYRPPPRPTYTRVPRSFLTEIGVPSGALALLPTVPLLDTTGNLTVVILPAGVVLGGVAPDLSGLVTEVTVPIASLGVTGLFPAISQTFNVIVLPGGGLVQLVGFVPGLPAGSRSIGIPIAPMLLLAGLPTILTVRLKFHTPLRVDVLPHQTTITVLPHQTTVDIL